MNNKFISTIIGIAIIASVGSLVYSQENQRTPSPQKETPTGDAAQTQYSLTDILKHDSESDCWAVINDGVYDLTSWIPRHPGGKQAILGLCGKDGSAAFDAQHGGAAKQAEILATMRIGTLKQ